MTPFHKAIGKLEDLGTDFAAQSEINSVPDQVLVLKAAEIKEKLVTLQDTDSKVRLALSQSKFYLKAISQNKEVELYEFEMKIVCAVFCIMFCIFLIFDFARLSPMTR